MLPRLALLLLLLAPPARAATETFYLGTYTNGTTSAGIYLGTLDSATGKLGPLRVAAAVKADPTFLALTPNGQFLFAALNDAVASFAIRPDGTLTEICREPGGRNICYVAFDSTGRRVFAACYDSGNILSFGVDANGRIGGAKSSVTLVGSGPNAGRQGSSHPHCVVVDPENRHLYACDLGADRIWNFRLDDLGRPVPGKPFGIAAPPGSGPRHLVFSPDGKLVYVANELGVSTSVYARNAATGALTLDTTVPNLPPPWPVGTGSAELAIDPTKKWLLVSTRLEDFLTVFRINPNYNPRLVGKQLLPLNSTAVVPSPVKFPRSFALDPTGKWVIVAGETDNRIAVLKLDPATGTLTPTDQSAPAPRPVAVLFANP
jgi:6-phosphogluconolactonase